MKTCCCCIPLRAGSIIVAICGILLGAFGLYDLVTKLTDPEDENNDDMDKDKESDVYYLIYGISCGLELLLSIILLVAVLQRARRFIMLYVILNTIGLVFNLLVLIVQGSFLIYLDVVEIGVSIIVGGLISFLFSGYFVLVVYRYAQDISYSV